MANLDDFINENREGFDDELPIGSFKRFEDRLAEQQNDTRWLVWFARIAVVVVVMFSVFLGSRWEITEVSQTVFPSEYLEVEKFYKASIDEKIQKLKNGNCGKDFVQEQRIMDDLREIDQNYERLRKEFGRSGNDEQLIEAMINCFRVKEDFLNQVLQQINKNC